MQAMKQLRQLSTGLARWSMINFFALIALALPIGVAAHTFDQSYVYFNVTDDALSGRIEATTEDLAKVFAAESEEFSTTDIQAREDELFAYFLDRLHVFAEGEKQQLEFSEITFLNTEAGEFAQLNFDIPNLTTVPESVEVSYDFLFSDIDPRHQGFALIESNTRTGVSDNESHVSLIFEAGDGPKTLWLNGEPVGQVIVQFLEHGVWHIWLGFDHVLFLITLLISSVMVIRGGKWVPAEGLRESLRKTVIIVTVFTVAHTITLGLAVFDVVTLPIVLVEAVIALSIAVVALGNLFPKLHAQSWKVVFVFGLFHGFGFANVLAPLGLDPARKAIGLASFNIGVELGQLAIVLVVFPIFYAVRRLAAYRIIVMQIGAVFLIAISLFWFIERTYDVLGPVTSNLKQMLR